MQTRIDSIAYVCPVLGGPAVFKARSLQSAYNDSNYFDDRLTCGQQGVFYKLAKKDTLTSVEEKLTLFPNPTNAQLNVIVASLVKENYSLTITNLLGVVVLKKEKLTNNFKLELGELNIAAGFYTLELKQNATGKSFRGQFIYEN